MEVPYIHSDDIHNFRAAKEVLPLVIELFKPDSILDVGCGTGTWLKIAKQLGVNKVIGVDGDYVNRQLLKIDETEFISKDIKTPFLLEQKFDIVLCLEVVEHLPEYSAKDIVSTLCSHSDIIIFSAAIPNQGGQNHLNEQWPSYWVEKFAKHDYKPFDFLRPIFWDNENVDFWYRQNMVVFSNIKELNFSGSINTLNAYVHPLLLQKKVEEINYLRNELFRINSNPGIKSNFQLLLKAVRKRYFGNKDLLI